MRRSTMLWITVFVVLMAPGFGSAAVLVAGKEVPRTAGERSARGLGGIRDVFYAPYNQATPAAQTAGGKPAGYFTYQVKPGDTLTQIAQNYLGNANMAYALASLNGIANPDQIQVGQTLQIPRPRIGLQYKIEVLQPTANGCAIGEVDDHHVFKSGDRFRFRLRSNVNGHLYVFNKGSSNNRYLLYPDPRVQGGNSYLTAYREYTIPAAGWFQFDNRPGTESLILVQSLKPVPQFGSFGGQSAPQPAPGQVYAAALNGQQWQSVIARLNSLNKSAQARDIFLAYDHPPQASNADYNQPQTGYISQTMNSPEDLFAVEIALEHR